MGTTWHHLELEQSSLGCWPCCSHSSIPPQCQAAATVALQHPWRGEGWLLHSPCYKEGLKCATRARDRAARQGGDSHHAMQPHMCVLTPMKTATPNPWCPVPSCHCLHPKDLCSCPEELDMSVDDGSPFLSYVHFSGLPANPAPW